MTDPPDPVFLSAITTEHFVMQTAIGAAVSEQQGRAAMYLYSLSGALVAMGFMAQSSNLMLFIAAVLPMIFLTGLLTILRLVDIGMESLQSHVTIARVRAYYRSLGNAAEAIFDKAHGRWPEGRTDSGHIIGPLLGLLTTAASMISCVNAFIGAALLALVLVRLLHVGLTLAIVAGAIFAVVQVVAFYVYQSWRIDLMIRSAQASGLAIGDDGRRADR